MRGVKFVWSNCMKFVVIVAGVGVLAALSAGCQPKSSSSTGSRNSQSTGQGGSSVNPQSSADDVEVAAGRKVFNSVGCARCHAIGGQGGGPGGDRPGRPGGDRPGGPSGPGGDRPGGPGGPGGDRPGGPGGDRPGGPGGDRPGGWGKGPDLSHVGAEHNADWIAEHVRDPQSHKPQSRMPKFPEAKINDADLKSLADYLAGLK
jgi:mono/diheme cytochrome c family protein